MTGRLRFMRSVSGAVGVTIVVFVVAVAIFGRYFAPHSPNVLVPRRSARRPATTGSAPTSSAATCSAACSTAAAP